MKIQLELNGPEPIVVNACISPIEFSTGGFHVGLGVACDAERG